MNFGAWQTACNIIVLICGFLVVIGGFGSYYFGKKLDESKDNLFLEKENKLKSQIETLSEKTKKTAFKIASNNIDAMPDGTYEITLKLIPVGKNVVPMLTISFETGNEAIIKKFDVSGPTVPIMSYDRTSKDLTAKSKEYRTIKPGEIRVKIITDKAPGKIHIGIDPLQKE